MRRLSALDEPDPNNDTVCQHVRRLAALMRLVLCFAHELGLDRFCARDLGVGVGEGVPGRTGWEGMGLWGRREDQGRMGRGWSAPGGRRKGGKEV